MILTFESWVLACFRLRARQAVVSAARAAPTGCSAMELNVRSVGHGSIEAEPPPGDNRGRRVCAAARCVDGACRKTPGFAVDDEAEPWLRAQGRGTRIRRATDH